LREKIKQLCSGLQKLGLAKGDVVGTYMGNNPEFVMLFLAAQRLGAVVTTCNPAYTPGRLAGMDYLKKRNSNCPQQCYTVK
jgi:acyl-CoA synthetase (AMP-forming)/AMP-acid ligase II